MTTVIDMEFNEMNGICGNAMNGVGNYRSSKMQNQDLSNKLILPDSGKKQWNAKFFCKMKLRFLSGDDIMALKVLCNEWFPIKYPDSWYKLIAYDDRFYSLAATVEDKIIAVLIAEIKPRWQVQKEDSDMLAASFPHDTKVAYILSLGVHEPYRRQGVASFLLHNFLTSTCAQENTSGKEVKAIYLHVLSTNKVAIQFYEQHKFKLHHFLPAYYVIDGTPKDGYSYVLHINDGKPPITCLDYFYKSFNFFYYLYPCKLPSKVLLRISNVLRYFMAWPSFSPFVSKARPCHNL